MPVTASSYVLWAKSQAKAVVVRAKVISTTAEFD